MVLLVLSIASGVFWGSFGRNHGWELASTLIVSMVSWVVLYTVTRSLNLP